MRLAELVMMFLDFDPVAPNFLQHDFPTPSVTLDDAVSISRRALATHPVAEIGLVFNDLSVRIPSQQGWLIARAMKPSVLVVVFDHMTA